ncbi:MAG: sigma-54-dependent Fis family transcriptional regulator [Verrucomicrobia bacterium]|nr:sigma-54-dependent Fis family transcriptional regulator [Verrucomicrobiota bacterium]
MALQNVLVVDDEPLIRKFLVETLTRMGFEVQSAADGAEALKKVKAETFDLVFTDIRMPHLSGMELLRAVRECTPESVVVMMTAYATVESAVEAMKVGAFDYIIKPFSPDQIEMVIKRAAERQSLIEENTYLRGEILKEHGFGEIIGKAAVMHGVFEVIRKVANSRATVLVQGESGTGKELVARAIHYNSARANAPFIKVNCAALPESLLESELFGHEKGAFTGAVMRRPGRFELAHRGTLLLDEISEIPLGLQAKLLRVLQEREFERVGGTRPIKVDVRIVTTTNRNLDEEIEAKRFREDLFFRLNVIPITLPPLRERDGDVLMLAQHFVERYSRENNRPPKTIARDAIEAMSAYSWPGNVRELQNVIERAIVLDADDEIRAEHLTLRPVGQEGDDTDEIVDAVGHTVAEMERRLILKTLQALGGNRGRTAEVLQISVRTLRNKLNQYRAEGVFAAPRGAGALV